MNKYNAREYIPLLEALADGELQMNYGAKKSPVWITAEAVCFTRPPQFYRRKPKPRQAWVVCNKDTGTPICVHATEEAARRSTASWPDRIYYLAQEVIK